MNLGPFLRAFIRVVGSRDQDGVLSWDALTLGLEPQFLQYSEKSVNYKPTGSEPPFSLAG